MNELSVTKPYQRRRRFSRKFKARIVAQCLEPGASVSPIALETGLTPTWSGAGSVRLVYRRQDTRGSVRRGPESEEGSEEPRGASLVL